MSKIKIVIAEDEEEILNYFSGIINSAPDMEVIGTARSGEEAVKAALEKTPALSSWTYR